MNSGSQRLCDIAVRVQMVGLQDIRIGSRGVRTITGMTRRDGRFQLFEHFAAVLARKFRSRHIRSGPDRLGVPSLLGNSGLDAVHDAVEVVGDLALIEGLCRQGRVRWTILTSNISMAFYIRHVHLDWTPFIRIVK